MAENIKNTLTTPANISGWMVQFDFPKFPLEKNKLFETYTAALNYAKGPDSYIGNVISILNDEIIGEGTDAITYYAGVYEVTGIGASGAITRVGKDTDLSGVETRLTSLESYATVQVSTYNELTSTYNAGKILYLTQTVNNGLEGDEKLEYLAGAYISLGSGQLQKLSTSDAGGATPEDRLTALETSVNSIKADIYQDGDLNVYTKSEVDNAITTKISGVYRFKGSVASNKLPSADNVTGDVWNVTDNFTISGVEYPAGTNVVWTGTEWDALAGIIDYSNVYAPKSHTHTVNDITDLATVAKTGSYNDLTDKPTIPSIDGLATQESVNTLSGTVGTLSTEVSTIKATLSTENANNGDVLTYNGSTVIWSSVPAGTTINTTDGKSTISVGETSTVVYTSDQVDTLLSNKQNSLLNGTETAGQVATIVKEGAGSKIVWSNPQVTTVTNDTTTGTSVITYTDSNGAETSTTVYTSAQTDKQIEIALQWNKLVNTEGPNA